jgi:DNA-binding Lrp family transcriptional regulator
MLARKRAFASPMHTQANSTHEHQRRRRPAIGTAGDRDSDSSDVAVLRLLSEQVAIPLDQLARFLGVGLAEVVSRGRAFEDSGWIEHRRFLVRDYPWFWLSCRGARVAATGFPYRVPDVSSLAHRRALNEIRLHLADRAPQGRWLCERIVYRQRDPRDRIPDAIFEIDGERHAIEAELSPKANREIRPIVAQHSNRYDAVLYFCGRGTYNLMKRVQAEGRWPKLVVRRLPEGE